MVRSPGPQDYATIDTDKYRRRQSVVPQCTFSTAVREIAYNSGSKERPKSPGPHCYQVNKTMLLRKNPSATFGNTIRKVAQPIK